MNKLNNKGFAISTMLYGLLIVLILVITTMITTMSFNRKNSKEFTDTIIDELEQEKRSNIPIEVDPSSDKNKNYDVSSAGNIHVGGSATQNQYITLQPGGFQYGPYDKTIEVGTYKVTYTGAYLDSILDSDILCYENAVSSFEIYNISKSKTNITYYVSVTNNTSTNGIEFYIYNNSSNAITINKIHLEKIS